MNEAQAERKEIDFQSDVWYKEEKNARTNAIFIHQIKNARILSFCRHH